MATNGLEFAGRRGLSLKMKLILGFILILIAIIGLALSLRKGPEDDTKKVAETSAASKQKKATKKAEAAPVVAAASEVPGVVPPEVVVVPAPAPAQAAPVSMCMTKEEVKDLFKKNECPQPQAAAAKPKPKAKVKYVAKAPAYVAPPVVQAPAPVNPPQQVAKSDFRDRCFLQADPGARLNSNPQVLIPPGTIIAETKHSALLLEGTDCKTWSAKKAGELVWKPKAFALVEKKCNRSFNDGRVESANGGSYESCTDAKSTLTSSSASDAPATAPATRPVSSQSVCERVWSDGRVERKLGLSRSDCDVYRGAVTPSP